MKKSLFILSILLCVSLILNLYQFYLIVGLNIENLKWQNDYGELETQYESTRKPNLHKINYGFSDSSFSGTIFNSGVETAYNVKVILSCDSWSYIIQVGTINGGNYKDFSKSVSLPEEYKDRAILASLQWDETP